MALSQSWDGHSMQEHKRWRQNASQTEKKECARLWAVYDKDIVELEGRALDGRGSKDPDHSRYVTSSDGVDVCLYGVKGRNRFWMFAAIAEQEKKCRLVIIGKCDSPDPWKVATQRIGQWQVR